MTSYELAIWNGARPANDVVALTTYLDLYEQYIDTESLAPPSRRIRNFLQTLLRRWPEKDDSPWTGTPRVGPRDHRGSTRDRRFHRFP